MRTGRLGSLDPNGCRRCLKNEGVLTMGPFDERGCEVMAGGGGVAALVGWKLFGVLAVAAVAFGAGFRFLLPGILGLELKCRACRRTWDGPIPPDVAEEARQKQVKAFVLGVACLVAAVLLALLWMLAVRAQQPG